MVTKKCKQVGSFRAWYGSINSFAFRTSPTFYHALGKSVFAFVQALLTFERVRYSASI